MLSTNALLAGRNLEQATADGWLGRGEGGGKVEIEEGEGQKEERNRRIQHTPKNQQKRPQFKVLVLCLDCVVLAKAGDAQPAGEQRGPPAHQHPADQ